MNRPQPKKEIEMEALIELCERHLDFIQTYNRVGYTFIGTIWEEVMQAVYGQEIHEWVKAQCHHKMILGVPDVPEKKSTTRKIIEGMFEVHRKNYTK